MNDFHINSINSIKSSSKQEIMLYLKKFGRTNLKTLSENLNMSKMGVLKHIGALEELGYIDRETEKAEKGRPKVFFKLSDTTRESIFPNNYSSITNYFLTFIEENFGREAVYKALQERNMEVNKKYQIELTKNQSLEEKVGMLRLLRDKEGYMADLHILSNNSFELLEYNCPIFKIAEQYSYSCTLEREMFEELLETKVETTHRVVDGQNVCRFLISKENELKGV
jgi:predicted ArsR family transcriptional regulator